MEDVYILWRNLFRRGNIHESPYIVRLYKNKETAVQELVRSRTMYPYDDFDLVLYKMIV